MLYISDMKKNDKIIKVIEELEYELAKIKYLFDKYPDIKISRGVYSSKLVNQDYDDFFVQSSYHSLEFGALKKIDFQHNGKIENLCIYSIPLNNRVINREFKYSKNYSKKEDILVFTKFFQTVKTKKFDDAVISRMRKEILKYIEEYSNAKIDTQNLDDKMKKLLNFR